MSKVLAAALAGLLVLSPMQANAAVWSDTKLNEMQVLFCVGFFPPLAPKIVMSIIEGETNEQIRDRFVIDEKEFDERFVDWYKDTAYKITVYMRQQMKDNPMGVPEDDAYFMCMSNIKEVKTDL